MIRAYQHGPNSMTVQIGRTEFLFSYETCVAFRIGGDSWVLSENVWSRATGRHIAQQFPPTYPRTPYVEFCAMLRRIETTVREEQDA